MRARKLVGNREGSYVANPGGGSSGCELERRLLLLSTRGKTLARRRTLSVIGWYGAE